MIKLKPKQLNGFAWMLSMTVISLALIAWGQAYDWEVASIYTLFPLFGLLAFSLMWAHYIVAVVRGYFGLERKVVNTYFEATSFLVLVAILLHPGLLAWQLWRDGQGLPPASEINYVAPALRGSVIIGLTAWLIFIAYEFRRKFKNHSWWKYIQYASDGAMLLIFIHALRLGTQLQSGWFKGVWFFYGVTLILSLIYIYTNKYRQKTKAI